MEKDRKWYIIKQDKLNLALQRVQKKLTHFKQLSETHFYEPYETMSEEERQKWRNEMNSWQWNDWNDLETRIEDRIKDNCFDYSQWHFDTFNWVAF